MGEKTRGIPRTYKLPEDLLKDLGIVCEELGTSRDEYVAEALGEKLGKDLPKALASAQQRQEAKKKVTPLQSVRQDASLKRRPRKGLRGLS